MIFHTRAEIRILSSSAEKYLTRERKLLEILRFTFTPNSKREFVPRDQFFALLVVNCLLLQLKKRVVSRQFYT